jgi:hypothetical protein
MVQSGRVQKKSRPHRIASHRLVYVLTPPQSHTHTLSLSLSLLSFMRGGRAQSFRGVGLHSHFLLLMSSRNPPVEVFSSKKKKGHCNNPWVDSQSTTTTTTTTTRTGIDPGTDRRKRNGQLPKGALPVEVWKRRVYRPRAIRQTGLVHALPLITSFLSLSFLFLF